MGINATLIGQFITFAILVWFTMKYVWPPIIKTLQDREKKIIAGLEAAERSKRELEMAEHKVAAMIREAKQHASQIIEQANLHAAQLVEEAKNHAQIAGQKMLELAKNEFEREVAQVKEGLKNQLAELTVIGAEKIIQRKLDPAIHHDLLNDLAAGL